MILHCPYCDTKANFKLWWHGGKNQDGSGPFYERIVPLVSKYVFRCDNCKDFVFLRTSGENVNDTFPFKETTKLLPGVPEPILEDLHEAYKCLAVSTFKAGAAMCRRALQGAAIEKGANPKNKLIKQIEEIKEKGALHPNLAELVTHIRLVGDSGAHPGEDGHEK